MLKLYLPVENEIIKDLNCKFSSSVAVGIVLPKILNTVYKKDNITTKEHTVHANKQRK